MENVINPHFSPGSPARGVKVGERMTLRMETGELRGAIVLRPARRSWPEARTHKRVAGGVSVDTPRTTSAEDAASGQKRPLDGELW